MLLKEYLQKELTKEFEIKKVWKIKILGIGWLIPENESLLSEENMFWICQKKQEIYIAEQQALLLMQITGLTNGREQCSW